VFVAGSVAVQAATCAAGRAQPFVRGENLTDTRYETVYNDSTPGVSVYAGLTAKF
jgi:hypothetical protein